MSRKTEFEDEEAHLPRNLVVVDQMSLVVRPAAATSTVEKRPENTTTKNFKKFTKVCITLLYNSAYMKLLSCK